MKTVDEWPSDIREAQEARRREDAVRERVRHAALTGTTMIVSGPEALTLLRLIQREGD